METKSYSEKIVTLQPNMADFLEKVAKLFKMSVNELAHKLMMKGVAAILVEKSMLGYGLELDNIPSKPNPPPMRVIREDGPKPKRGE